MKRLATLSEEANFLKKNPYRYRAQVDRFINKNRAAVDLDKVVDLLRNSDEYYIKLDADEVRHYRQVQLYKGAGKIDEMLSLANELAFGAMRDLFDDLGIKNQTLQYTSHETATDSRDKNELSSL